MAFWVLAADCVRTERPARINWIEIQRWPPFACAERERSIVHFRERRVKSHAELFVRRGSPLFSTLSWRPFVPRLRTHG